MKSYKFVLLLVLSCGFSGVVLSGCSSSNRSEPQHETEHGEVTTKQTTEEGVNVIVNPYAQNVYKYEGKSYQKLSNTNLEKPWVVSEEGSAEESRLKQPPQPVLKAHAQYR